MNITQNHGRQGFAAYLRRRWQLYAMLLIPAFVVLLFNYVPLYGLTIAFKDFNPGEGIVDSPWVGLKWFKTAMVMPDFTSIVWNTFIIAVGKIVCGQIAAIIFALLLNEVANPVYKRIVQTVTYFPHFLSWVIIGGIFTDMLSTTGILNQFLGIFGIKPIFFLGSNQWFQPTMVILETWKEFGWGAIVYLAAMTNISPDLYEAAAMDGAGRLKSIWHITLPGISSIIVMLCVLNIGNILNAGFDQILVMYNPAVYRTGDVLDTFIYRQGLLDAQYSLSTAIGLFKSVIGLVLTLTANYLATRFTNYRVF
ncbi:MAG: ABC transporter permease subunit [Acutalibacter sp.]|nr:ABC transporter permease subunit [Acutalibacter sp.]